MPATTITAQTMPGVYSTTGLVITEVAADPSNSNDVVVTDGQIIVVRNAGASSRAFTMTSVADAITGRTGDVSVSIAAGEMRFFRIAKNGWANSSTGKVTFNGAHADLKLSVVNF